MTERRFELALESFGKALSRLHEVLAMNETDVVRDALIQRFEFTFETGWKAMFRWLRARGAEVDDEAFAVLPRAFKNRLISDDDGWTELRKKRNLTAHTYKEELAVEVAAMVRARGVHLFDDLLRTLKARADE
jgi:nucleotidyltransferase substrate binding protein (TIGR01987 family)